MGTSSEDCRPGFVDSWHARYGCARCFTANQMDYLLHGNGGSDLGTSSQDSGVVFLAAAIVGPHRQKSLALSAATQLLVAASFINDIHNNASSHSGGTRRLATGHRDAIHCLLQALDATISGIYTAVSPLVINLTNAG